MKLTLAEMQRALTDLPQRARAGVMGDFEEVVSVAIDYIRCGAGKRCSVPLLYHLLPFFGCGLPSYLRRGYEDALMHGLSAILEELPVLCHVDPSDRAEVRSFLTLLLRRACEAAVRAKRGYLPTVRTGLRKALGALPSGGFLWRPERVGECALTNRMIVIEAIEGIEGDVIAQSRLPSRFVPLLRYAVRCHLRETDQRAVAFRTRGFEQEEIDFAFDYALIACRTLCYKLKERFELGRRGYETTPSLLRSKVLGLFGSRSAPPTRSVLSGPGSLGRKNLDPGDLRDLRVGVRDEVPGDLRGEDDSGSGRRCTSQSRPGRRRLLDPSRAAQGQGTQRGARASARSSCADRERDQGDRNPNAGALREGSVG